MCPAAASAYFICVSSLGPDRFECTGDGHAERQAGACQSEWDQFVLCRHDTVFECPDGRPTITDYQVCDGLEDCPDGNDEANCEDGGGAGGQGGTGA